MFRHFFHYVYDCQLVVVFDDSLVKSSDYILNNSELVEEFATRVQHLVRKHVLLAVHPQVREAFLRRVEDLCEVAEGAFFVQHFVRFAELVSVVTSLEIGLEHFAQSLNLVQKAFASPLPVIRIQIILVVRSLL